MRLVCGKRFLKAFSCVRALSLSLRPQWLIVFILSSCVDAGDVVVIWEKAGEVFLSSSFSCFP